MIKKINNIIILIFLILSSCKKEFQETSLLLPPNFDKLPKIEDKKQNKNNDQKEEKLQGKSSKKDIEDIKKLLLD